MVSEIEKKINNSTLTTSRRLAISFFRLFYTVLYPSTLQPDSNVHLLII